MKHQVVAPRQATPTPGSSSGGRSSLLPDDVVDEQVRRVWLLSGVSAFMWAFGLTMDGVVFPRTLGVSVQPVQLVVDAIGAATALAIFLTLRFAPISSKRKVDSGLGVDIPPPTVGTPPPPGPIRRRRKKRASPSARSTAVSRSAPVATFT
ncbi:MAG TPA: hypothetical protein VF491_19155, partial [Vicinamibacterales bacterium]